MKKAIFCIQNHLIEDILKSSKLLNENSIVVKNKNELNLKFINHHKPDFIMFPHWSHKVPAEIYQNFKCICFHSSPLPYGRGGSPIQNMIKLGHNETEVCSLLMTEEFDAGPVYIRTKTSLKGNLDQILIRIYKAIADQIHELLKKDIEPVEQVGKVVKFSRITDNSIEFNQPLIKIFDKIRMLDSSIYPQSYIDIEDCKIEFKNAIYKEDQIEANISIKKISKNEE